MDTAELIYPLDRVECWDILFSNFLIERLNKNSYPYELGVCDCNLFVADAVKIITGQDVFGEWRGAYSSEAEAYEKLASTNELNSVESVLTSSLNVDPHNDVRRARRGDVVIITVKDHPFVGMVDDTGRRIAAMTPNHGLVRVPMSHIVSIWSY